MLPASCFRNPVMILYKVVLPLPFVPINTFMSPLSKEKDTSVKTSFSPNDLAICFVWNFIFSLSVFNDSLVQTRETIIINFCLKTLKNGAMFFIRFCRAVGLAAMATYFQIAPKRNQPCAPTAVFPMNFFFESSKYSTVENAPFSNNAVKIRPRLATTGLSNRTAKSTKKLNPNKTLAV